MQNAILRHSSAFADTWASGQTNGPILNTREHALAGVVLPSNFDAGITTLKFDVSPDGVSFTRLYDLDTNTEISKTVAANRAYALPIECLAFPFVRLVGNAAPAADRTITICQLS